MTIRHGAAVVAVVVVLLPLMTATQTEPPLTSAEGQRLEPKLAQIVTNGQSDTPSTPTVLYQREVNAYLTFQAAEALPIGVTDPFIAFGDNGHLSARAAVDLGAVSSSQPRGILDPLAYLSGVVPVAASGVLHTANGGGRLDIDSVSVGGIPVPRAVLHELVRYYSRTGSQPDGVDLSEPFTLPYQIVEVRISRSQATVVQ